MKALPQSFASRASIPVLGPPRWCAPADDPAYPEDAKRPDRAPAGVAQDTQRNLALRLPKASKLLRHADFQRVYRQGRRHFAAHMTVFYMRREEAGPTPSTGDGPRVGLTVGRVLGGAVERNRIKRRLREAVRHHLGSLALGVDVVINPKKSALTVDFMILRDEVARAFQVIREKLLA